jgi:hypothetical protein
LNNVIRPSFPAVATALREGGEPPDNGAMEARVAKLEASATHIEREMSQLRADVREIKRDQRDDFRVLFGAIIVVTLGLAGLLAKGFKWL